MSSSNSNSASSNVQRDNFLFYIAQIYEALGIPREMRQPLLEAFAKYNDNQKYIFLQSDALKDAFNALITADNQLKALASGKLNPHIEKIKDSWNQTLYQLSRLQGLAILQKVNESDCSEVINELLKALNQKLDSVNTIIQSNLEDTAKQPATVPVTSSSSSSAEGGGGSGNKKPLSLRTVSNAALASNTKQGGRQKYFAIGGSDDLYKAKYLKYKQKYLQLKNNL